MSSRPDDDEGAYVDGALDVVEAWLDSLEDPRDVPDLDDLDPFPIVEDDPS